MKQGPVVFVSHFQTFTADVAQMLNLSGYFTCRIVTCFRRFEGTVRFQVGGKKETVRLSKSTAAYNPTRRSSLDHHLKISFYWEGRPETIITVVLC